VVLYQESERYNILLRKMKGTLAALRSGIAGTVVITPELEQLFDALLVGRVPAAWGFAYPSLKPLASWVKDLHARLHFMRQWLAHGQPAAFWISGFFFPQGFATGALQMYARKTRIAIDTLDFRSHIMPFMEDAVPAAPEAMRCAFGVGSICSSC
jgi:dynein heavy chain